MAGKKVSRNAQVLLSALDKEFVVTTTQAMEMLDISEATARRLFRTMASNGIALRTFGGICRIQEAISDYSYESLSLKNNDAKRLIAKKALGLVTSTDVIYIDGGTTLAAFSEELASRIDTGEIKDITVYTNSMATLNALAGKCSVSLLGGRWRENRRDFCGYLAEDAVRKLSFTACFLGTDACEERGLTTTDFETARLNELVVSSSKFCYALADSIKFTQNSFVPFAKLSQLTAIVTDKGISDTVLREYTAFGVKIII